MGLQQKMTHCQASKKWENMKKRYKELKNPPEGVKAFPEMWPFFSLMDDAMEGRLEGNAPILKAYSSDHNNGDFLPVSQPKKRKPSTMEISSALIVDGPEIEVSMNSDVDGEEVAVQQGSLEIGRIMQEAEDEKNRMDSQQQVKEREKEVMERERLVLQRERAVLDREIAILDRDRALLEREKATMERERATVEREKAVMERERTMVEKDRDAVYKDRLTLEQEKAKLGRTSAATESTKKIAEDSSEVKESDTMNRKERFFTLFEKLIENL
ncbi:caldesmon [Stegastes partitus]|uniref:Caldesmon n=1 Tax=Stegastes partitus TaxID=144197 RepID=A0A9Y4JLK9_9TELE|nr:PREDICTED: caldesmon-like [Stegastes partitus]